MNNKATTPISDDLYVQGKEAASYIWRHWRERPRIEEPRQPDFARGAIEEIINRLADSDDVDKEIREYSEAAAEQLTTPSRTIFEILQNADDLGATSLKFAVRRSGRGELLAAHNGDPVELPHIIAMTLAFISSKRDDARSKGRFGIGLKTLNQIGSVISVHCPPYHFSVERGTLRDIEPIEKMRGLYDGSARETLISISLDGEFEIEDVEAWIKEIDSSYLIFQDKLRSLSFVDARTGKQTWSAALYETSLPPVSIELRSGANFIAHRANLYDQGDDGRQWTRYFIDYPVPKTHKRAHKATGATTPLAVAISESAESGFVAAGLPFDFLQSLPVSLNAQFDPDLSRRDLREVEWNKWLFQRLAEVLGGIALYRFSDDPSTAWQAVPLNGEFEDNRSWTASQINELVGNVQERVCSRARINVEGQVLSLKDISYSAARVSRILTKNDQKFLAAGKTPLPQKFCDKKGRWRQTLDFLGISYKLDICDVIKLLDLPDEELGTRTISWFIRVADTAISSELDEEISERRSILAADGSRHRPDSDALLVRNLEAGSIAARLGMEVAVSEEYFSEHTPIRVKKWIRHFVHESASKNPSAFLSALSNRNSSDPLPLDDSSLVLLRDALEAADDVHRLSVAAAVGRVISVDGFEFQDGERKKCRVLLATSYLPTAITKDKSGWAVAAKSTEGLRWIDPRYSKVLSSKKSGKLGVRRFFALLGASSGPRLEANSEEFRTYWPGVPEFQKVSLQQLPSGDGYKVNRLRGDHISPDLESVIADIVVQPIDERRRQRSRALYETLVREWDTLDEYAYADAMYHHYKWRTAGKVPATWLARLASEPWLSSKSKTKVAPSGMAIDSTATRLTRGKNRSQYLHELNEADSEHPLIRAIGVKGSPPASELIDELKGLKSNFEDEVKISDAYPLYEALSVLIKNERAHRVSDMSAAEIRRAFEAHALLLTELGWTAPSRVFRGRAIFKKRRAFVPNNSSLAPLWKLLQVREPALKDCLLVIEEIAEPKEDLRNDEEGLVVDVLRAIVEMREEIKGRIKTRVAKLPLWTSLGWTSNRPVYAVFDDTLFEELKGRIPLWKPGCSMDSLGDLPDILGVELLTDRDFQLAGGLEVEPADEFTLHVFRSTISRLKTNLARKSQDLWSSLDWDSLSTMNLSQAKPLLTRSNVLGKKTTVSQIVHVDGKSHLYFSDPEDLAKPEVGVRILSPFISGKSPELLDFAWSFAWRQAEDEDAPMEELELAENTERETDETLNNLASKGKKSIGKRLFAGGAIKKGSRKGKDGTGSSDRRRLKSFENYSISDAEIIHSNQSKKVIKSKRRPLIEDPTGISPKTKSRVSSPKKDWNELEKEQLGFELLAAALKEIDDLELEDFSSLRGVGADSIDNLKRYFEMKVFSGQARDDVRFEASEFERAVKVGKKYFLAVISGLEEGNETEIRIFSDPVRTLSLRKIPRIRLGGILSNEAPTLLLKLDTQS